MCRRIVGTNRLIAAAGDELAGEDDDRPHRNLARRACARRCSQRLPHPILRVSHAVSLHCNM